MNDGHTESTDDKGQVFFTTGAGTNLEDINNTEPENNLDLSNQLASWMPEHDTRKIGSSAISTPPNPDSGNFYPHAPESTPNYGEIVNLEMPPDAISPTTIATPGSAERTLAGDIVEIKTDHNLNSHGMTAIDEAISKLNQDGDIASFYETSRDMTEANLDNSFNRKVGKRAIYD